MAAKTQKKTTAKPKSAKRAPKKAAPKKSTPKRAPKKATAKKSAPKRTVRRSTLTVSDRDRTVAEKATTAMKRGNAESSRGPVNATQVALIRNVVGRRSVVTIAKQLGFASGAELTKHSRGELKSMPDGASAKLAEFASQKSIADAPGGSKIRGRKLTAIIANL